MKTRNTIMPGLALAGLFFFFGLLALHDFGVTWDENETFQASLDNSAALSDWTFDRPSRHELPGYYFCMDTLRGLFASTVVSRGLMDVAAAFHLFHLVLASLSIFLLYLLVLRTSDSARAAVFAALTLALLPKFIGHSQNNPKDLPGLFAFVLAMYAVLHATFSGGFLRTALAGIVLGFACTTHLACFTIPVIAGAWFVIADRGLLAREWRRIFMLLGASAAAFILFWPWLWTDTGNRLLAAFRVGSSFKVAEPILFAGHLYTWTTTPWYYFLGSFLISTPVLFIFLAAASGMLFLRGGGEGLNKLKRTALLGLLWCGWLVAFELTASSHYDGIRHVLMFLPGFCVLAGMGAEAILRRGFIFYPSRLRMLAPPVAVLLLIGLGYLLVCIAIARIHPYEDAYLNEMTNALIGGKAEDYFEVEYWGTTYKEGAEWIDRNAEGNAAVYYVWTPQVLYHAKRPVEVFNADAFFHDTRRPQYLMLMTRAALYDERLRRVAREYRPVFSITRQKGTLLNIYKNTAMMQAGRTGGVQ